MGIEIVYGNEKYFQGFHSALDQVAREQIYIEMTEAKAFSDIATFQAKLIANNWPVYYAVDGDKVVGWADISRSENPRVAHRGFLGMGLLKAYRGQGLGSQILKRALGHAKEIGLEKIELSVYTTNEAAIRLYRKFGFKDIGVIKNYRKLNGRYFDALEMDLFL